MSKLTDQLDALLDELRHHRRDGVATTTDVLRLAEMLKVVATTVGFKPTDLPPIGNERCKSVGPASREQCHKQVGHWTVHESEIGSTWE